MKKVDVLKKEFSYKKRSQTTPPIDEVIYFRHHHRVWEPHEATIKLVIKRDATGKYLGSSLHFSDCGFIEDGREEC